MNIDNIIEADNFYFRAATNAPCNNVSSPRGPLSLITTNYIAITCIMFIHVI